MHQLKYKHHCNPVIRAVIPCGIVTYIIDAFIVYSNHGSFADEYRTGLVAAFIVMLILGSFTYIFVQRRVRLMKQTILLCIKGIIDSDTLQQTNQYVMKADVSSQIFTYSVAIKSCFASLFVDKRRLLYVDQYGNNISALQRVEVNKLIHHFQAIEDRIKLILNEA